MTKPSEELQKSDPDRVMTAMFAPEQIRQRLFALYAFYQEIARIPDSVSEAMIGQMRLAWAADAVKDLYASPPKIRRHNVYEDLAGLLAINSGPDEESLQALIEARGADLGQGVFPNADERLAYIDKTAVNLMRLATQLCLEAPLSDNQDTAITAAGRLWGLTGLITAFAPLTEAGRPPLTEDELSDAGLNEADLARGVETEAVMSAIQHGLVASANEQRKAFNQLRSILPVEAFPAFGYVRLASAYVRRVAALSDPFRQRPELSTTSRQFQLIWASLTGRT